jgi:hypothetical protein
MRRDLAHRPTKTSVLQRVLASAYRRALRRWPMPMVVAYADGGAGDGLEVLDAADGVADEELAVAST